jgi:hypothetical protein
MNEEIKSMALQFMGAWIQGVTARLSAGRFPTVTQDHVDSSIQLAHMMQQRLESSSLLSVDIPDASGEPSEPDVPPEPPQPPGPEDIVMGEAEPVAFEEERADRVERGTRSRKP